jgi:hypothetical protein
LFTELKRRNVPRASVLYVGAAWAVAQGSALPETDRRQTGDPGARRSALMLPMMDPIRGDARLVGVVKRLKTTDPDFDEVCTGNP